MMSKKRIDSLDILKMIAIWLIVSGHVIRKGPVMDYTSAAGVPLFFFAAGLVAKDDRSLLQRLIKRFRQLMIPYLLVGHISILIYRVLGQFAASAVGVGMSGTLPTNLVELVYANSKSGHMKWNESLWFIPCFFVVCLMHEGVCLCGMTGKRQRGKQLMFIVCALLLHYVTTQFYHLHFPWQFETALGMLPIFELGVMAKTCFRQLHEYVVRGKMTSTLICVALGLGLAVAGALLNRNLGQVAIRNDLYPVYPVSYLMIGITILGYLLFSEGITPILPEKLRNRMTFMGRQTLYILLWNKFPVLFIQVMTLHLIPEFSGLFMETRQPAGVLLAAALAIVCIVMCLIWVQIYRKLIGYALSFKHDNTN